MLSDTVRETIEYTLKRGPQQIINPVRIRTEESQLRMIIFSVINGTFLDSNLKTVEDSLNLMHSLGLVGNCSMDYYHSNKPSLDSILEKYMTIQRQYTADDISTCYNSLLTSEIYVSDNHITYGVQKDRRDMTGSYYTPNLLALDAVKKALESYFETNGKLSTDEHPEMRIIDLSCGCGEFLLMCRKCLVEDYSFSQESIKNWFYGADIDPIAIQITVVRLYSGHGIPDRNTIDNHFFIGNSLYFSNSDNDQSKFETYVEGRFYSEKNGALEKIVEHTYDLVIGNPPWEKVRFEDRKFFRQYSSGIADNTKKADRERSVQQLKNEDLVLYSLYEKQTSDYSSFKEKIASDGLLKESLLGELNTYALFTELSLRIMKKTGTCGLILKSSIMTSPVYSSMFKWLMDTEILSNVFFFNNSNRIFDIDSREQFCVAFFKYNSCSVGVSFGLTTIENFDTYPTIDITKTDIGVLNPITLQIPGIQSNEQLAILLEIHKKCSLFVNVFPECHYGRLVHLTTHSNYISSTPSDNNMPILEGKMLGRYTSRNSSFSDVSKEKKYAHKAKSKSTTNTESFEQQCRYFIEKNAWNEITKNYKGAYSLYWRSLTSSTNSRTMIATIDRHMPSCQSIQLLQCDNLDEMLLILSIFNSAIFDDILRMKLCGIDLTQKIIKQMPVPSRNRLADVINYNGTSAPIRDHLIHRARHLLRNVFDEDASGFTENDRDIMADIDRIVAIAYNVP